MYISAPAKVNLYLDILGKRPDGYHEIRTVMQTVDLCDRIRIEERKRGISFKCAGDAPSGPENLARRAADLFLRTAGIRGGVRIELTKQIPPQRGLGGGSSDAASVLAGLNRLFKTDLPDRVLMGMAAQLGSDVPFFLRGGTALCEGRGERVKPIRTDARLCFVLLLPEFGISTGRVYQALTKKDLTPPNAGDRILLKAVRRGDSETVALGLYNRLERPAFRLCPALRLLKQEMAALGFMGVLMSGSGSAILGIAPDRATATSLAESGSRKRLGRMVAVCAFHCGDPD